MGFAVPQDQVLYKVNEVARMFRVSVMSVYRLIESGDLKAIRVGRSYRIPRHALEEYLEGSFETVAANVIKVGAA